jgi:hypothetical protein
MAQYEITTETRPILWESVGLERVLQNCRNLMLLQAGEVPYGRWRGIDPALFHMTREETNYSLVPELDRVMQAEPRVQVADGWCEMRDTDGTAVYHCVVNIGED